MLTKRCAYFVYFSFKIYHWIEDHFYPGFSYIHFFPFIYSTNILWAPVPDSSGEELWLRKFGPCPYQGFTMVRILKVFAKTTQGTQNLCQPFLDSVWKSQKMLEWYPSCSHMLMVLHLNQFYYSDLLNGTWLIYMKQFVW